MLIHAIDNRVALICEKANKEPENKTVEKTQEVWMRCAFGLAAATVVLTAMHVIALPAGAVLTVLFLAAGFYAIMKAPAGIDYSNPEVLKALREEAKKESLDQIVNKHSWENLFRYELLTPDGIKAKFGELAAQQSFGKTIADYEAGLAAYEKVKRDIKIAAYEFPNLGAYLNKWVEEVEKADLTTIAEVEKRCDLDKLVTWGSISEGTREEMQLIYIYKKHKDPVDALEIGVQKFLELDQRQGAKDIREAEGEGYKQVFWDRLWELRKVAADPSGVLGDLLKQEEDKSGPLPQWAQIFFSLSLTPASIMVMDSRTQNIHGPEDIAMTREDILALIDDGFNEAKKNVRHYLLTGFQGYFPKSTQELFEYELNSFCKERGIQRSK